MKKVKRFCGMLFAVLFVIMSISPYALAMEQPEDAQELTFNEYEYLKGLEKLQESALDNKIPMNYQKIKETYYSELDRRSLLPQEKLEKMGYSIEKIALLRKYADGAGLSDAEMRSLSGTCTGTITAARCTAQIANFRYSWSWDQQPAIALTDAAAIRWRVVDVSAYEIRVHTASVVTAVEYYYGNQVIYRTTGDIETGFEFDVVKIGFPVLKGFFTDVNEYELSYAKKGYINVVIEPYEGTETEIRVVDVLGLYGHTLIGVGAPSISIGSGISFSFTGNTSVDNIARKQRVFTAT